MSLKRDVAKVMEVNPTLPTISAILTEADRVGALDIKSLIEVVKLIADYVDEFPEPKKVA